MRVQLSVVIVAMTDPTASSNPDVKVFDWGNNNVVLSAFFWGYIGLQFVSAHFGRKYGSKPFLLVTGTINATAVALVPLLADRFGSYGVIGSRVVQGLCQGFVYTSVSNLLGRWTHLDEISRLGSLALAGAPFGTILSLPINGFIASSRLGWPYCFYIFAAAGYLWVILYFFIGASSPAQSKYITEAEKNYIESSRKIEHKKRPIPICSILKSRPFWVLFFTQVGQTWGYNTLLTEIPTYMNKMMQFDMKSNGLLSAAPYTACFLFAFVFGFSADSLINHNYLSRTATRKVFNAISGFGAGASLLILAFLPIRAKIASVLLLISAVGIQSAAIAGYSLNHVDLSPNYAGVLQALCNSCGSGISIFAPLTVHFVVTDETNKSQWQIIFIVAAMMYIIPSIFFSTFASGKIQKWDGSDPEEARKLSEIRSKKVSVWSIMSV